MRVRYEAMKVIMVPLKNRELRGFVIWLCSSSK